MKCLPSFLAEAYRKLQGKSQNYEFTQLFIPLRSLYEAHVSYHCWLGNILDNCNHSKGKVPYKLVPNPFEFKQKFTTLSRTFLPPLCFIRAPPTASIMSISRMNNQVSSANIPVLNCVGEDEWLSPSPKQPQALSHPRLHRAKTTMLFSRVDVVSTGQTLGKAWPGLSLWIQYLPIKVRSDGRVYVFLKHLSSQLPYISARLSHCSPVQLPMSCCPERFIQAANTIYLLASAQGQAEML